MSKQARTLWFGAVLLTLALSVPAQGDAFLISAGENSEAHTAAGFDGENYLVTWTDQSDVGWAIRGARVRDDGYVLGSFTICDASAGRQRDYSQIAFDGENYLVVWEDCRDDGVVKIYGARVSRAGQVLPPDVFPIADENLPFVGDPGPDLRPAVAFGVDRFLVAGVRREVLNGPASIFCCGVSRDGAVLFEGVQISGTGVFRCQCPAVTASDGGFLVVWDSVIGLGDYIFRVFAFSCG